MLFHQVTFFVDNDALGSFENLSYVGNFWEVMLTFI